MFFESVREWKSSLASIHLTAVVTENLGTVCFSVEEIIQVISEVMSDSVAVSVESDRGLRIIGENPSSRL